MSKDIEFLGFYDGEEVEEVVIPDDAYADEKQSDEAPANEENKTEQTEPSVEQGDVVNTKDTEQNTQKVAEYTPEELAEINNRIKNGEPPRIDPERLPEVNKVLHKNLQGIITKKSQQLSEEIKKLEEIKKQIILSKQDKDEIYKQAKEMSKRELGEDFDELDPKTFVDIYEKVGIITDKVKTDRAEARIGETTQERLLQTVTELKKLEPDFDKVDDIAEQLLNNLPAWQRDVFVAESRKGNFEPFKALFLEARKIYRSGIPQPQTKQPPKTESSGTGRGSFSPKKDVDELLDLMGFNL